MSEKLNYTRLAPPAPETYTSEQKKAAEEFLALRKEEETFGARGADYRARMLAGLRMVPAPADRGEIRRQTGNRRRDPRRPPPRRNERGRGARLRFLHRAAPNQKRFR